MVVNDVCFTRWYRQSFFALILNKVVLFPFNSESTSAVCCISAYSIGSEKTII